MAITVVVRSSVICLSSVIWRSFNIKKQILSSLIFFLLRGLLSRYLLHNLTPNSQPHLAVQMVENFRDSTVEPMIYICEAIYHKAASAMAEEDSSLLKLASLTISFKSSIAYI